VARHTSDLQRRSAPKASESSVQVIEEQALTYEVRVFDQRTITICIDPLQIFEQFLAAIYHPNQSATRVMILDVRFKMRVEFVDACCQESNLNFGRPGIVLRAGVSGDDVRLG